MLIKNEKLGIFHKYSNNIKEWDFVKKKKKKEDILMRRFLPEIKILRLI